MCGVTTTEGRAASEEEDEICPGVGVDDDDEENVLGLGWWWYPPLPPLLSSEGTTQQHTHEAVGRNGPYITLQIWWCVRVVWLELVKEEGRRKMKREEEEQPQAPIHHCQNLAADAATER